MSLVYATKKTALPRFKISLNFKTGLCFSKQSRIESIHNRRKKETSESESEREKQRSCRRFALSFFTLDKAF